MAPPTAAEQELAVSGWPAPQRAEYEAWPFEVRTYYWSLTPERRELFWRFSDADKVSLPAAEATPDEEKPPH